MKQLQILYTSTVKESSTPEKVSKMLDTMERHAISNAPWPEFPYKPEADFAIAYNDSHILLKYYVKENAIEASYHRINDPVYKDTCVEFFIAFDDEDSYYNLEFNCAGTCLMGFGTGRGARKLLPASVIKNIKHQSLIQTKENTADGSIYWELTLLIPFSVFHHHYFISLKNQNCRVNFYKCGDDLPQPHFLCWNPIEIPAPDFHRPDFFAPAQFICNQTHILNQNA